MGVVTFPPATALDGYDWSMTKEQALKALEESAELVEAVKFYEHVRSEEWFDTSETGAESALLAMRFTSRQSVLDEAMDVYQTLANLLAGEFTDGEVAEAYERCLERNRERGRL